MHVIILPFTIIEAALLIKEFSFPIPHSITFKAFIPTTIFILFNNIVSLIVGTSWPRSFTDFWDCAKWLVWFTFSRSSLDVVIVFTLLMDYDIGTLWVCIMITCDFVKNIVNWTLAFYALCNWNICHILKNFWVIFLSADRAIHARNCGYLRLILLNLSLVLLIIEFGWRNWCKAFNSLASWSFNWIDYRQRRFQRLNGSLVWKTVSIISAIEVWIN